MQRTLACLKLHRAQRAHCPQQPGADRVAPLLCHVSLVVLISASANVLQHPQGDIPLYFRPPGFLTSSFCWLTSPTSIVRVFKSNRASPPNSPRLNLVDILLIPIDLEAGGVDRNSSCFI